MVYRPCEVPRLRGAAYGKARSGPGDPDGVMTTGDG